MCWYKTLRDFNRNPPDLRGIIKILLKKKKKEKEKEKEKKKVELASSQIHVNQI